ncbi:MAG: sigma factor [Longimicrobiales bacterium]
MWDADRAQDLAQEAFARVLDHAPDNPRAWVFAVAGNLARDELRSVVRRKKHLTLLKSKCWCCATGRRCRAAGDTVPGFRRSWSKRVDRRLNAGGAT